MSKPKNEIKPRIKEEKEIKDKKRDKKKKEKKEKAQAAAKEPKEREKVPFEELPRKLQKRIQKRKQMKTERKTTRKLRVDWTKSDDQILEKFKQIYPEQSQDKLLMNIKY